MKARKQTRAKGPRMIKEILRLRDMGLSKRMIAKALGCSRNTVDKYLAEPEPLAPQPEYQAPWSEHIDWQLVSQETAKGTPLVEYWEARVEPLEGMTIPYVSFWREYKRRFPHVPIACA